MKRVVRLVLPVAVSVVLLWLSFRDVDMAEARAELANVRMGYVWLYLLTLIVTQACRVFRWDILIRPFARITTRQLLRVSNIGLMLIFALPLRLGELARPYLLKQEAGASMSAGLGAVAAERAIDGLLVTALFFITTQRLDAPYQVSALLEASAWVSLALFGALFVVIIATLVAQERAFRLVRRIGTPFGPALTERAVRMLGSFVTGLRALPDLRAVLAFTLWTLVYWCANGLGLWWVMQAFGWALPPSAGFVLVCVLVLGIMIPAGPGYAGAFQAALRVGLAVFGVGATDAAAYGLIVYPLNALVIVGAGVPYLFGRGTSLRTIVEASSEVA